MKNETVNSFSFFALQPHPHVPRHHGTYYRGCHDQHDDDIDHAVVDEPLAGSVDRPVGHQRN